MATGFNGAQVYDPAGQFNQGGLNQAVNQGYQGRLGSAQQYQQQLGLGNQQFGQQSALQGQALAGQEQLQQGQLASQALGYQTQKDVAGIQANAAMYPAQLQQQRFSQVFPYLSSALGQASSSSGQLAGQANMTGQPNISARPVYTQGDIQQQVNQQQAQNDQSTATQTRKMQGQLAGRGEGANSPLAQALGMGLQNQNLATNTQNAASTRLNSAQANATQRLAGQQAQETQYSNRQTEAIQRAQVYQNYLSSALGAMSGLV